MFGIVEAGETADEGGGEVKLIIFESETAGVFELL